MKKSLMKSLHEKINATPKPQLILYIAIASVFTHFIFTCAVLLGLAIYAVSNKEIRNSIYKIKGFYWLLFFSVLIVVVPACYHRWISVGAGLSLIIVLIFMLYAHSMMTIHIYHQAIDIACIMSTLCFIVALGQKFYFGFSFRSQAGLLNANYYATIIEFVILMCVYRIITNTNKSYFYLIIIVINIGGLFLCDCQSSWLAIIAGVLVILYFNGYKKHAIIFFVIAALLLIFGVFIPGMLPRLDRMPQTISTRMQIWTAAVNGIKKHPLFGQGTLTYLFSYLDNGGPQAYKTYHAHSLYLDPLLSFGIAGVSLMSGYIITYFSRIFKMRKDVKVKPVVGLITATVVSVGVHGFTDITILWIQTGMLLCFILSGIAIKDNDSKLPNEKA